MQTKIDFELLLFHAKEAAGKAYSPYSGYRVGAALLTASGRIFTGCNVENASYSLTSCAERNAVFTALGEGFRDFVAIAVYADSEEAFPPCGACRQVLAEFNAEIPILYVNMRERVLTDLGKLFPESFHLKG